MGFMILKRMLMIFSGKTLKTIRQNNKGQISVYLAIILSSVILLSGGLVDIARITTGRKYVNRAGHTAARSALANYSSILKDRYGIFALDLNGHVKLEEIIEKYLDANIKTEDDTFDIYDFRVESVKITPLSNLAENRVIRNQILEYMKYRAPKEITVEILDKLKAVKDAGKISGAYEKKTEIDKKLEKIDEIHKQLKKNLEGTIGDGIYQKLFVSGFNEGGIREKAVKQTVEMIIELKGLSLYERNIKQEIDALMLSIAEEEEKEEEENGKNIEEEEKSKEENDEAEDGIEGEIKNENETENEGESESENEIDILNEKLELKLQELNDTEVDIKRLKTQINSLLGNLRIAQTKAFIEPNVKAFNNIQNIVKISRDVSVKIDGLDSFLREISDGAGEFTQGFAGTFYEDINEMKKLVFDAKSVAEISNALSRNIEFLNNALNDIKEIEQMIDTPENISLSANELEKMFNKVISEYNNGLRHVYEFIQCESGIPDPRKLYENEVKKYFAIKNYKERNMIEEGVDVSKLPSRLAEEELSDETLYEGDLSKPGSDVDFSNNNTEFSIRGFSFIKSIGNFLEKKFESLRDEIYIDEYIIGTFKNSVPVLKGEDANTTARNLRYMEIPKLGSFFESEVEYILNGNVSERANKLMTEGQILLIRFGLNTLHVYNDSVKKQTARAIAAAVTGWWTGGAGIPIVSNLVMCGWGMGEALIDLKDLLDGRSVPLYKTKENWKLALKLPGNQKPESDIDLYMPEFTYYDYLRLFLLLRDSDCKMNRIKDLIQINTGMEKNDFEISKCSTVLRVEISISMRYFFATGMFFKDDKKTTDGKHLFNIVVYESY